MPSDGVWYDAGVHGGGTYVVTLALGLLSALAPTVARAQGAAAEASAPRSAALSWVRLPGAEVCPTAQDVARAVEERLGFSVFVSPADAELTIEGRIEPAPSGGFRATLTLNEASGASLGERVVDGADADCSAILPMLGLSLALTIDPGALSRLAAAEAVEPEPMLPSPAPPPAEPPPLPPEPWRFEVTGSLLGGLGVSPTASIGGALTLALSPPGFVPIFVAGALAPWSRADVVGSSGVEVLATYVGLGICPLAFRETAPVSLFACAGLDVGALVAISGRDAVTEPERITVQADVSFGVHVTLAGPLYFAAAVALLVPFRGEPFLLRGPPTATWFDPEPVAGVLTLGLGLDLPL